MMQYRMLGNTGLRVSEIGFGCGNVGGLMVRGSHDQQISSVRHALDLGINYFDTARAYGEGQSETNLGRVLEEIGEEVILSTKIRLESDALQDIAAATASEVEQGLARLGRGSVDLIQLHTRLVEKREPGRFAMTPDEVLGPGGVIEAFKRLRDQGRVGFFGFTGLGDVEAIHALVDSGEFHSFQAYYNLLNPSAGQAVPEGFSALDYGRVIDRAAAGGMGVVIIRVLAAGRGAERGSGIGRRQQPRTAFHRIRLRARRGPGTQAGLSQGPRAGIAATGGHPLRLHEARGEHRTGGVFQQRADRRGRGMLRGGSVAGGGHGRRCARSGTGTSATVRSVCRPTG